MSRRAPFPFHLSEPSEATRYRLLRDQSSCSVTHAPGERYRRRTYSTELGSGSDVFAAAATVLERWTMHARAGFRVIATTPLAQPGVSVLLTFRVWPLWVTVACRVVQVVDTGAEKGFTYATLPLHAERGRQTFLVSQSDDGRVTFTVSSESRPQALLARVAAPVTAVLQRRAAARYLSAMQALCDRGSPG